MSEDNPATADCPEKLHPDKDRQLMETCTKVTVIEDKRDTVEQLENNNAIDDSENPEILKEPSHCEMLKGESGSEQNTITNDDNGFEKENMMSNESHETTDSNKNNSDDQEIIGNTCREKDENGMTAIDHKDSNMCTQKSYDDLNSDTCISEIELHKDSDTSSNANDNNGVDKDRNACNVEPDMARDERVEFGHETTKDNKEGDVLQTEHLVETSHRCIEDVNSSQTAPSRKRKLVCLICFCFERLAEIA